MDKSTKHLPRESLGDSYNSAPLSDLLMNPWLNKSKIVFSSGGARTHTTRVRITEADFAVSV